jgi:hypothetical protein
MYGGTRMTNGTRFSYADIVRKRIIYRQNGTTQEHDRIIIQASDGTDNSIPATIWFLLNGVADPEPTPSLTPSATAIPSVTPSATATITLTPSRTATATKTATRTRTATITQSATRTQTATLTRSATRTPIPSRTMSPSRTVVVKSSSPKHP